MVLCIFFCSLSLTYMVFLLKLAITLNLIDSFQKQNTLTTNFQMHSGQSQIKVPHLLNYFNNKSALLLPVTLRSEIIKV